MLAIGLTGGIGSGKSEVASLLAERGAVIIDADAVVREVQAPGGPAYAGIVDRFGTHILGPDGALDRPALAAAVFGDAAARADLEGLTHPHVRHLMAERLLEQAASGNVVILAVPLLAEAGRAAYPVDGILVVDCPTDLAIRRLVEMRGLAQDDARARMASQTSREERLAIADFVVDNSGTMAALEAEVERAWEWIASLRSAPTER